MNKIVYGCMMILAVGFVACQGKRGAETASGLSAIHFDFDSSAIKPDMIKIMDSNANYLQKHKGLNIVVEGHCDERGTNEYNLALGDRRANAAKQYLTSKNIGSSKVRSLSYGEEKPAQKGHTESAWYMNRRAEFVRQTHKD